jgi:hypothetical protein
MRKTRLVRKRFVSEDIVRRHDVTYNGEPVTYDDEPVFYDEYPPISSLILPVPDEDVLPTTSHGEAEQKATSAKGCGVWTCIKKVVEKGWQIFTKSFWEAVLDRVWPKQ